MQKIVIAFALAAILIMCLLVSCAGENGADTSQTRSSAAERPRAESAPQQVPDYSADTSSYPENSGRFPGTEYSGTVSQ